MNVRSSAQVRAEGTVGEGAVEADLLAQVRSDAETTIVIVGYTRPRELPVAPVHHVRLGGELREREPDELQFNPQPEEPHPERPEPFSWTDITYLLDQVHVSWAMYLDHGAQPPANLTAKATSPTMANEPHGV